MLSWVLKMIANLLLERSRAKKSINKQVFFFIFFHRKIHFVLFSLALLDGPHLASRTIVHMVQIPDTFDLIFEKIASIFFLVLIAIDFANLVQFPFFFSSPSFDKNLVN